ncbi:TIGR02587 family membrane protein [Luteolibacter pohnpeiensis]|uniref:TIGR02587 family membrane protein n=1 Tax=Luteolibacter pohnpeiensis TaxID=454153 RepID=A0A934SFZ6_9BACT|nr:TIGR02587 family membrane protein [Luteolibacter pohnpeiensis]MBK1884478.1 TIGR02587 family membrane protein [Luteolibacter pohnpeiensis]
MIAFSHHRTIPESMREYGRGIVGGIMFSLPLIYTMEVWRAGLLLHPARIIAYMGVTFVLLIAYNRHAGLRRDATWLEVLIDSIEEMGLGLVISALILWLMGRFNHDLPPSEIIAMVAMEAMTVAIGVSVGTAQLGADDGGDSGSSDEGKQDGGGYSGQCAVALCGAVLFAANIAPTDEISVLAMQLSATQLLVISLVTLTLGAWVLHYSDFHNAGTRVAVDSRFEKIRGTISTYAIALLASVGALFFFGRLDQQSLAQCLAMTVVLALPSVLGASAGRLLLQSSNRNPS